MIKEINKINFKLTIFSNTIKFINKLIKNKKMLYDQVEKTYKK